MLTNGLIKDGGTSVYFRGSVYSGECTLWAGEALDEVCHGTGMFEKDGETYKVVIHRNAVIKVNIDDNTTFTCNTNSCDTYHGAYTNTGGHNLLMYNRNEDLFD